MPTPALMLLSALATQDSVPGQEAVDLEELGRHELSSAHPFELASWLWGGLGSARERWASRGFAVEAYVTTDVSSHLSGGADPGSTALRGLLDALVTVDGGRVMGIPESRVVFGVQAFGGDDGSAAVGVIQDYSNIDAADDRVQVARVWYEQSWNGAGTRVRIGKMDANGLFAGVPSATRFIHSSMAFSPTILGLPTYPDTAFGVALGQEVGDCVTLHLGVFDGAASSGVRTGSAGPASVFSHPDEAFLIAQASASWSSGSLTLGGWHHSGSFARFDGGDENGTEGSYLVLDQELLADSLGRSLASYLQLGQADGHVSSITGHVGLGAVAKNVILPERRDVLGLGASCARLSDASGAGFTTDAETAIEAFWGLDLAPGLRIKPDLQYIVDPGGDASRDDAWILTLRLTASL